MSFASCSTRILYSSSLLVILFIVVLQIWVCGDCKAEAIRVLQDKAMDKNLKSSKIITSSSNKVSRSEERFRKYFNGWSHRFNKTEKGFNESKRRVPSCPDPLHN